MSSAAFLVACHMCTYINKIIICVQLFMLANDWLIVCDAWPVRRQTYGYLTSLRRYQINTAWWQKHVCWTTCPGLQLPGSDAPTRSEGVMDAE